ncbi:SpoVG family protein [Oscillospiraceae bacterium PP1C4]
MHITLTKLRLIDNPTVKAVASILIDDVLAIHDIKVIKRAGSADLLVAMPSKEDKHGVYRNVVHPINPQLREEIEGLVINEYKKAGGKTNE